MLLTASLRKGADHPTSFDAWTAARERRARPKHPTALLSDVVAWRSATVARRCGMCRTSPTKRRCDCVKTGMRTSGVPSRLPGRPAPPNALMVCLKADVSSRPRRHLDVSSNQHHGHAGNPKSGSTAVKSCPRNQRCSNSPVLSRTGLCCVWAFDSRKLQHPEQVAVKLHWPALATTRVARLHHDLLNKWTDHLTRGRAVTRCQMLIKVRDCAEIQGFVIRR